MKGANRDERLQRTQLSAAITAAPFRKGRAETATDPDLLARNCAIFIDIYI